MIQTNINTANSNQDLTLEAFSSLKKFSHKISLYDGACFIFHLIIFHVFKSFWLNFSFASY